MKRFFLTLSFVFVTLFLALPFGYAINLEPRILAKVGSEAITVYDVKKKLDVIFIQQSPEYAGNEAARFEFYSRFWKDALRELVQAKLVLMNAKEKEEKISQKMVTESDVHREMQSRFEPNVIENLAKIGLSYDEGARLILDELKVQTMIWISVHSNTQQKVSPELIRERYEKLIQQTPNKHTWRYQAITLNADNEKERQALVDLIHSELASKDLTKLASLSEKASAQLGKTRISSSTADLKTGVTSTLKISPILQTGEDEITPIRREALEKLSSGQASELIEESTRSSGKKVHRILVLHDKIAAKLPTFEEKQSELKNVCLSEVFEQDMSAYVKSLEERYGIEVCYPEGFEPFTR